MAAIILVIYHTKPDEFSPKFEVVGCFVEYNGEILLLHRQDSSPEGNTWGIPSGKIDDGENPIVAVIREVAEETGYSINSSQVLALPKVFVRFPEYDFVYHMFRTELGEKQDVRLNHSEHKDFKWVRPADALSMPLIQDLDNCIKLVYRI